MQSSASRRGSQRGKYREFYSTLCNDLHVKSVFKKKKKNRNRVTKAENRHTLTKDRARRDKLGDED